MGKNVLICDDDEGIIEVVKLVLEEQGYSISICSHGDDAIKLIRKLKPDIVLLDLWMPGLGGAEITLKVKSDNLIKNIPIVIVSANKDTLKIAKQVGADDFLSKPFDIEDLENIVLKHTNGGSVN